MNTPTKPATPTPTPTPTPIAAKPSQVTPSAAPTNIIKAPPPFQLRTIGGVSPWLKLMAYSEPGLGKTTLCASAADVPQMNDVIWIDAEKSELAIMDNPRVKNPDKIFRVEVSSFQEIAKVHDWLKGHCKARDAGNIEALRKEEARLRGCTLEEVTEPKQFRTVILDSLHEANAFSLYELLGVDENKVIAGDKDETDVAGWPEFRMNMQRMNLLLRAFRDLPMNFLATAHAAYKQDELKKFFYEPALTGQLSRQVQGFFDIVGFMKSEKQGDKTERRLYVQPISNFHAKNRRAVFTGTHFTDPTMHSIMEQVKLLKTA